ncbi:DNA polymerase I [Piscinibacter terrae]|uniref:DNA polymerase I n=1 Tax=Piscinibacter terrae TaxID=2496871 RepID=A0A3N7HUW2_9BURK|nr:DNA polymerase I [Albitalea terrae]RQP26120.1 DNA polymerase I [Albitalea terrae]
MTAEITTESDPGTLLLVDGSSYLYRAFHALPDLRSPDGFPTGAIHGMVAMLKWLRDKIPCEHAACVFDAKGKTFRDDWYAEYKANRAAMPEDLALQVEPIHEVVKLLGWPVLQVPGVEADDVIGTLACAAARGGHKVVISTGDKDLAQLVTPKVSLINTMSKPPEVLDVDGVIAKFGVPPDRIIDYLTLIGDTVDNVPGVDKVGPKTAVKWIAEHGSLDGVIANAAGIKGVVGDNLRRALDWLPQGRRLVTVVTDCDLAGHVMDWPEFQSLAFGDVKREALLEFYQRYGFKTMRKELEAELAGDAAIASGDLFSEQPAAAAAAEPLNKHYETVVSREALDAWMAKIETAPLTAIDTETDSLDGMVARIVGISLSVAPGEAAYIPLRHNYAGAPDQLPADEVLARFKPWLENPAKLKLGQNIKYDTHVFANAGIDVQGYAHDTMLQSYVFEAHKPHSLESLADRHLGRHGLSYEDVCGKGANQIPFAQVEVNRAAEYSCEDSDMTLHVHQTLWPRIESDAGLRRIYEEIEMPVSQVLKRIERNGVLIDAAVLQAQSQQLGERMMQLEREAYDMAGQPFNIGSPKQIGEVLYTKLAMPVLKRTASGAPSTDEEVLEKLAEDYPLPAKILEHRSLSKLKGTYTDKLPLMVNPATGRVHTNYAQAVAVTGRLSSNDPNLQNIPIRTAEGRRIREAFIAPPGHVVLSADYSQIELRLMAHISEDVNLVKAFVEGMDVHRATASEVFGVKPEEVTSEQRRYAKTINFGLIYGMSAFGLASSLGIERSAASAYIERYFARYPGVKRYMDETKASAKAQGFVETVFGRRLWLPEINSPNGPRKSGAERQAINAPMQGTAADLIKLSMIAVQKVLDEERRATKMVMQVHDELVFEVPDAEVEWARAAIPKIMSDVAAMKVPLVAEVGVGPNWDEAH